MLKKDASSCLLYSEPWPLRNPDIKKLRLPISLICRFLAVHTGHIFKKLSLS
jgi:hypothetical protein